MDAKRLKSIPLFEQLPKGDLDRLARWTDEVEVPAGARLTRQEGFAHEFAIIEDGAATVYQNGEKINDLGPGDFFGEIGLLDETARRTADVVASTPMRLIVMFGRDFRQMEREMPAVAAQIRTTMEERLTRS
jgi:CRP/FNR family transcriptional regulator, cyclic AMP receptor protein